MTKCKYLLKKKLYRGVYQEPTLLLMYDGGGLTVISLVDSVVGS